MTYLGSPPASQAFAPGTDTFNGDGTTVAFTLSRNVATVNDILVIVNNVEQQPSNYSVSTSTLTFSTAPSSGTNNIYVRYLSTNLVTIAPQQGSVTRQSMDIGSGGVGTGAAQMPVGTTSDRPATPLVGMYRMNTTTGLPEWYSSATSSWVIFSSLTTYTVEYLVIAGGGAGGYGAAGGGGAGGYRSSVIGEASGGGATAESVLTLTTNTSYTVTIGAGGATTSTNGNNTVFGSITSIGGGGGSTIAGASGGSGGGAGYQATVGVAGAGTTGQGYAGGTAGYAAPYYPPAGGGGAGAVGQSPSSGSDTVGKIGGVGVQSSINGTATFRAGGGGGSGSTQGALAGAGGNGGGGAGSVIGTATAGTANTGGGGGGTHTGTAGAGGSGVVIFRYAGAQRGTGGTVTTSGSYTIHTFTTSGVYIA